MHIAQNRRHTGNAKANDGYYRYSGAVHVHSRYSDGSGSISEIGAIADRVGMDFVIITDHSAMEAAERNEDGYYGSSLAIVGEEVNTSAGHLLSLGTSRHLEQKGPRGLPALLDSISAAGGSALAAHPYGRRPWTEWNLKRLRGIELVNGDSEWRDDSPLEHLSALMWYPLASTAALNSLIDYPALSLKRFDAMAAAGHAVAVGSVDAHARIPLWGDELIAFPPYEQMFNWIRTYVITRSPLTGNGEADSALIVDALKSGRSYIAIESLGSADGFSFEYTVEDQTVSLGESIESSGAGEFRVSTGMPDGVSVRLVKDGTTVFETESTEFVVDDMGEGVYRVEVYLLSGGFPWLWQAQRPWIFSNPIWLE